MTPREVVVAAAVAVAAAAAAVVVWVAAAVNEDLIDSTTAANANTSLRSHSQQPGGDYISICVIKERKYFIVWS